MTVTKRGNCICKTTRFEEAEELLYGGGLEALEGRVLEIGDLRLPIDSKEAVRCKKVNEIIKDYSGRSSTERPLCIGMFGPPGSGKSFMVKELAKDAIGQHIKPKTINLSQMEGPAEFAEHLLRILSESGGQLPVILMDEFDSSLGDEPLGWLKIFLAPMQDGKFFYNGKECQIQRAVLFFAGGTAERLDLFEKRHAPYFAARKGPDFVSRLRTTIDLEGINSFGKDRILRRALVLHQMLKKREPRLVNEATKTFNIKKEVLHRLLEGGHYRHGNRSLEAVLDITVFSDDKSKQKVSDKQFKMKDLPPPELLDMHLSRGPLDGKIIGISAGLFCEKTSEMAEEVARELISRGATVAYCGTEGKTLKRIVKIVKERKNPLHGSKDEPCILHVAHFPAFYHPKSIGNIGAKYLHIEKLESLSQSEKETLGVEDTFFEPFDTEGKYARNLHLAWAISLSRSRRRFVHLVDALVVIGGKGGADADPDDDVVVPNDIKKQLAWGRFPGVPEEVMLALRENKPIYIMGAAGGAASDIGVLLDLSDSNLFTAGCLPEPMFNHKAILKDLDAKFKELRSRAEDEPSLMLKSHQDLKDFIREHRISGDKWPNNGLTRKQNREIFRGTQAEWIPKPNKMKKVDKAMEKKREKYEKQFAKQVDKLIEGLTLTIASDNAYPAATGRRVDP